LPPLIKIAPKDWAHIQPEIIIITTKGIACAKLAWPKNCGLW
jgi:hypothetical protein